MSQMNRRRAERRSSHQEWHARGMRCQECGTLWYSAVAEIASAWARCIVCGGHLHVDRRSGEERRRSLRLVRRVA